MSSNLLIDNAEVQQATEEANLATTMFQKTMTATYKKLVQLEVRKQKEKFTRLFNEVLFKKATYLLLFYKIQKKDKSGFVIQESPDAKLVHRAVSLYLRNLPHGFAK